MVGCLKRTTNRQTGQHIYAMCRQPAAARAITTDNIINTTCRQRQPGALRTGLSASDVLRCSPSASGPASSGGPGARVRSASGRCELGRHSASSPSPAGSVLGMLRSAGCCGQVWVESWVRYGWGV